MPLRGFVRTIVRMSLFFATFSDRVLNRMVSGSPVGWDSDATDGDSWPATPSFTGDRGQWKRKHWVTAVISGSHWGNGWTISYSARCSCQAASSVGATSILSPGLPSPRG